MNQTESAIQEAEKGNTMVALMHLAKVAPKNKHPRLISYLAYCLAKELRQYNKAITLCKIAIEEAPQNPVLYLNLGRVCLAAGQKKQAIKAFRRGLKMGQSPEIIIELKKLGLRRDPVIPALPRGSFVNKHLGLLMCRLGLR